MGTNDAKYMHFYIYLQVKHDKLSSDMSACFFSPCVSLKGSILFQKLDVSNRFL